MVTNQYERDFSTTFAAKRPGRIDLRAFQNRDDAGDGHPGLQKQIRNWVQYWVGQMLYYDDEGNLLFDDRSNGFNQSIPLRVANKVGGSLANREYIQTRDSGKVTTRGPHLSPDGTKYFESMASTYIYGYDLTTPWDISTATNEVEASLTHSVGFGINGIDGFWFKPDGTKLYNCSQWSSNGVIYTWDLGTPWDLTTLADEPVEKAGIGYIKCMVISPDGTKIITSHTTIDLIKEWNLTTPWDVSTMSYVQSLATGGESRGLAVSYDGRMLWFSNLDSDYIIEYILTTPWDLSTAVFSYKIDSTDSNPVGLYVNQMGTKFYDCGADDVHEYTLHRQSNSSGRLIAWSQDLDDTHSSTSTSYVSTDAAVTLTFTEAVTVFMTAKVRTATLPSGAEAFFIINDGSDITETELYLSPEEATAVDYPLYTSYVKNYDPGTYTWTAKMKSEIGHNLTYDDIVISVMAYTQVPET